MLPIPPRRAGRLRRSLSALFKGGFPVSAGKKFILRKLKASNQYVLPLCSPSESIPTFKFYHNML